MCPAGSTFLNVRGPARLFERCADPAHGQALRCPGARSSAARPRRTVERCAAPEHGRALRGPGARSSAARPRITFERCSTSLKTTPRVLVSAAPEARLRPASRWVRGRCGLVTLCRVASAAARGPQPRLGLRPAVPYSVAPSSSSPTPPRGPQSPIRACAACDAGQSVPESAHGCPELVKHALLVEADGMRQTARRLRRRGAHPPTAPSRP